MLDRDKDCDGLISKMEWEGGFDYFDADTDGYITATDCSAVTKFCAKDIEDHLERVLAAGVAGPFAAAVGSAHGWRHGACFIPVVGPVWLH